MSNPSVFERAGEPRNLLGDWALRNGIGLAAIFVGWNKFAQGTEWVGIFEQIGLGQWFRYFTGVVEILGGLLVLIPRAAAAGRALLAVTMAAAALTFGARQELPISARLWECGASLASRTPFSKKVANHMHSVTQFHMHYNFVRIHQTRRVTPAMAARVTGNCGRFTDVVQLTESAAPLAA